MTTATATDISSIRINGDRLWASLMELAKIGATPKGGVCRLTLTDLDKQGRDLVLGWAREAGMAITIDKIGNGFMRRAGRNNSLPPIVTGSHIDTQPHLAQVTFANEDLQLDGRQVGQDSNRLACSDHFAWLRQAFEHRAGERDCQARLGELRPGQLKRFGGDLGLGVRASPLLLQRNGLVHASDIGVAHQIQALGGDPPLISEGLVAVKIRPRGHRMVSGEGDLCVNLRG